MPDKETWKFINTFASWLSAVGTFSAVVTSLYLARHDRHIRLEVSAGHRLMIAPGIEGPHPEYLSIKIVNVGHRDAQLKNIGWKVGLFRKQYAVQTIITDGVSSPLPIRLKDGEEANYLIPLNGQTNWLSSFVKDFLMPFPRLQVWAVKIQAFTTVGPKFESRIEKGLRNLLVKEAKKQKKS